MLGLFVFRSIGQVALPADRERAPPRPVPELPRAAVPRDRHDPGLAAGRSATTPTGRSVGFAILHRHRWLIGTLIVVYKLQDEYFTHVGNIDRSDFFQQLFERLGGG